MYNTAHFSRMPRAKIPGTRMKKPQIVAGTSLHGKCVPLFCNLVMPGTVDSNFCNGIIWMSNPIRPLLSQNKGKINVFFVPLRLVFGHTKEFFGENKTTAGPQTTVYKIPMNKPSSFGSVGVGSVSHYLGKPLTISSGALANTQINMSVLKERAFWLCWSEFYRHQQVQNPVILNTGDTGVIGTLNGSNLNFASAVPNCLKDFDYFTTGTISPNYGGEVLLPLGSVAPVYLYGSGHLDQGDSIGLEAYNGSTDLGVGALPARYKTDVYDATNSGSGRLYADLSAATAAKIDDLYTAMAAQAFYHNLNYGSRYFERLEISYGVSNPDLVLDRPEHVSEFTFDIFVQDVVSTAGATADAQSKLGQPGAVSKTVIRKKLYNHSFGEWGFVIGIMNTYHERYYSAGVQREDLLEEMLEFYTPEFANRGDDSIFDAEIVAAGGKSTFAFQEPYSWHRYYSNRVTGQLDPMGSAPLGPWILAEKYTSKPTLSASFLEENRDAIQNALVSGSAGPDYIWQFNFEHTEILPMPAYSKPGIPRFGNV